MANGSVHALYGHIVWPQSSDVRVFVLSTRRHPAHTLSVPILHPREIQALWSHNCNTAAETPHRCCKVLDKGVGSLKVESCEYAGFSVGWGATGSFR